MLNSMRWVLGRAPRWLLVLGELASAGCGETQSEETLGSNSNWLMLCDESTECQDELSCECGACLIRCQADSDCEALPDARCVLAEDPAATSVCTDAVPSGLCLPACQAGSCSAPWPCVDGACVPHTPPVAEFCAAVAGWDASASTVEDELLALLNEARAAGGVQCGTDPATNPLPIVDFDARLRCAARVFAADLAANNGATLVDSQGRDTQQRLQLAGYDHITWGEAFSLESDEQTAFADMLSRMDSCQPLVAQSAQSVGVGVVGNVAVITLGSAAP